MHLGISYNLCNKKNIVKILAPVLLTAGLSAATVKSCKNDMENTSSEIEQSVKTEKVPLSGMTYIFGIASLAALGCAGKNIFEVMKKNEKKELEPAPASLDLNKDEISENSKSYSIGDTKITEWYYTTGQLAKKCERSDSKDNKYHDYKMFDKDGNTITHNRYDYYETETKKDGSIEHYKDEEQEYIRDSYSTIKDGLMYHVDDFHAITCPEKSYKNVFVKELKTGKLIKIINDGKVIIL